MLRIILDAIRVLDRKPQPAWLRRYAREHAVEYEEGPPGGLEVTVKKHVLDRLKLLADRIKSNPEGAVNEVLFKHLLDTMVAGITDPKKFDSLPLAAQYHFRVRELPELLDTTTGTAIRCLLDHFAVACAVALEKWGEGW